MVTFSQPKKKKKGKKKKSNIPCDGYKIFLVIKGKKIPTKREC